MAPPAAIDSQITPISFQTLAEDEGGLSVAPASNQRQQQKTHTTKREPSPHRVRTTTRARQDAAALSNFSMRPSYPAVTFDKICFTVNKSQQQANFLGDCLARAKHCLTLGLGSQAAQEDQMIKILKSIDLNVPTGCIFGLLGPSSCGKTTLLRCLVGLLKPTSGCMRLFCQETRNFGSLSRGDEAAKIKGSKTRNLSKVPGSNVGYMPQDLGLYEDFTIRQLLTMFGQYMGMEGPLIRQRIGFMTDFLDLPHADREIASLSGGQKRRVSFAIACLHMPPLIILDEPTVGVDPLLRQSIWRYLRRLADEENKTIIITTHYIEEAAQADQVALMRAGEILVQDSPRKIMQSNGCKTLEEAFLKICSNANQGANNLSQQQPLVARLRPQLKFEWRDKVKCELNELMEKSRKVAADSHQQLDQAPEKVTTPDDGEAEGDGDTKVTDSIVRRLQEKAQEKLAIFEYLQTKHAQFEQQQQQQQHDDWEQQKAKKAREFERRPGDGGSFGAATSPVSLDPIEATKRTLASSTSIRCLNRRSKLVISGQPAKSPANCDSLQFPSQLNHNHRHLYHHEADPLNSGLVSSSEELSRVGARSRWLSSRQRWRKATSLMWALLYKNYRRNVNSLPLLAFQFMLPIVQMISFSLCIGGRPTQIGLGLVNHDQLISYETGEPASLLGSSNSSALLSTDLLDPAAGWTNDTELLSTRYLSFLDETILSVRPYDSLRDALSDVRRGKLWAAMEIGPNFTRSIASRFDLENFYQLDLETIRQSVIKLFPDRSNKVLDMICHRSLVNSYRSFLIDEFEHFRRLPVEVKEPIFDIKPNLISNSMDGYTESIAAGLLASLTYIMAAGLTTFIMVVERSAGILERTYTSGISPTAYLLAHAAFRSLVMMLQIGLVLFLTFYLLQQPLVGSIWLAYLMLMTLNLTGIAYGLLISSLVSDQNGAALTIVSSLVVKITMSGILWPFEAIPRWLRTICYVQPMTMPVQALKSITLKGSGLDDRSVYLGFVVSLTWLAVFLTISARRFKFYQH